MLHEAPLQGRNGAPCSACGCGSAEEERSLNQQQCILRSGGPCCCRVKTEHNVQSAGVAVQEMKFEPAAMHVGEQLTSLQATQLLQRKAECEAVGPTCRVKTEYLILRAVVAGQEMKLLVAVVVNDAMEHLDR
eukprot:1160346-Pelagomonas_calceolata.AAC.2